MRLDLDYRQILVPIDFTDTARMAFYVALKYAREHDATTHVLHVTEPLGTFDGDSSVEATEAELARLEGGVKRRINDLFDEGGLKEVDRRKVHVDFRAGDVSTEILRAITEHQIDLVVMGHNPEKRKGLKKLMGGASPAERVMDKAPCHVLVVKPPDYEYVPDAIPEKFSKV